MRDEDFSKSWLTCEIFNIHQIILTRMAADFMCILLSGTLLCIFEVVISNQTAIYHFSR